MSGEPGPILILGGTGRVGQAMARSTLWGQRGLWQYRPGRRPPLGPDGQALPGLEWDLASPPPLPHLPKDIAAVILLAGVTGHDPAALQANTTLALTACDLAEAAGIPRVLIASSQAVYGAASGAVTEDAACHPANPYGQAKLAMEAAVAGRPGVTCLRLGNVAGADMLFRMAAQGPVTLDRFADGQSPRRALIGPVTLARILQRLADPALDLPALLNIAHPGLVAMADLLQAAGLPFAWRPAPATALPELALDVRRLCALYPLPPACAQTLLAEARQGGWPANCRE